MATEWKKKRLGDLISIKGGLSYKKEFIGAGTALLIGMGCVSHTERFLREGAKRYSGVFSNTHTVNPGDLVIATRQQSDNMPILGFPAMIPEELKDFDVVVATNLYKVSNPSDVSSRFLYWLLRGKEYRERILSSSKGTTVRMITKESIEDFEFLCPPKEEREKIVNILDALDDKIELNRRMNATLEAMAQALFRAWFVDFEPVHANFENRVSTSASPEIAKLFPSEFENDIPKGWTLATVASVSSLVTRGVTPKYGESTGRFIINQRVNRGIDLNFSELKELASDLDVSQEKYAQKYDVLVNCLGEGTLGRTHLYLGENDKYAVDQHMSICRPGDWRTSFYLYYILAGEEGQNKIESLKTGTTGMTMFNISKLRNFGFTLPTDPVLAAYGNSVFASWEMIERNRKESQVLAKLRDSLLPRLISGKIRVPQITEEIE